MPFSRRIGLRMSAWSTSGITIACRSAAMRPAKPSPTGIVTPCSTSSSMPLAARARSTSPFGSSMRMAAVSLSSAAATRSSSSASRSSSERYASAASVTRWSASSRSRALRSCAKRCAWSMAIAARSAASWSSSWSSSVNSRGVRLPTCRTPSGAAPDEHGDAEQRADALLAQDRVEDVGVVDVVDHDRLALRHDAAGEAAPHRHARALLDLLLQALGSARVEHLAVGLEHQDRRRVAAQDLGDAIEQRGQQLVLGEIGERGVRDALERLELAAHLPIIGGLRQPQVSGTRAPKAQVSPPPDD